MYIVHIQELSHATSTKTRKEQRKMQSTHVHTPNNPHSPIYMYVAYTGLNIHEDICLSTRASVVYTYYVERGTEVIWIAH